MAEIADYDQSGYDYTKYWKGRQYEHEAEKTALSRLLPTNGDSILDLGGSFGRLMEVYAPRFTQATILDYSQFALDQAKQYANEKQITNLETVKGDAYHTPFPDQSFDAIMMVRVLHHIEDTKALFTEVKRILRPGGVFILDVPNKNHLKAQIRALLRGNLTYSSQRTPIKHTNTMINGQTGIFYNFHPTAIAQELESIGFSCEEKLSISNLRVGLLKHYLASETLLKIDRLIQPLFTSLAWGPSVWLRCRLP